MDRLGFVGVGLMGERMAASAVRGGADVSVVAHHRRDAVERLTAVGATEAPDLATLARSVDAIVLCVTDAPAVEAVVRAMEDHLTSGQMILDASTSQPQTSVSLAGRLAGRGVRWADIPVTGSPAQSAQGRLATLLGTAPEDVERASAIAALWSAKVRLFGGPGAGHTGKLVNNFVTQGTTVLLAEAYGTARHAGVDWAALHDVMVTGAARSGTFEKMVSPALEGDFDGAAFTVVNAAKDARYYAQMRRDVCGAPSPIAEVVHDMLQHAVDAGFAERYVSRLLDPALADSLAPSEKVTP